MVIHRLDNSAANMTYGRVLRDVARGVVEQGKKDGASL